MKCLFKIFVFPAVLTLLIMACNKDTSHSPGKATLTVSKSTVARGEPLTISAALPSGAQSIKWTVSPSVGTTKLFPNKDAATAFFGSPGTYHVTANYYADSAGSGNAFDSSSSPITVSDSIYSPPSIPVYDTAALAGANIQIEPITASDTGGLILVAQTDTRYDCYPQLNWYMNQAGNAIDIHFLSVANMPASTCNGVTDNTAKAYIFAGRPANGVYDLHVIVNSVTYAGTLTVTDNSFTYSWPYTAGVTISPLQVGSK